ncbi:MAG: hypothetical protein Rpha_0439 [Candidatus Ruthia sp. Apha_13_S6]|nr:hypothetical protein [Candidatus Ruthia sp. Apha_13_S6]
MINTLGVHIFILKLKYALSMPESRYTITIPNSFNPKQY